MTRAEGGAERPADALEFPCDFPLKIMGRDENDFRAATVALVESHFGPLPAGAVTARPSRNGRFVSITVTVRAQNRAQLDAVYRALTAVDDVLMVL